MNAREIAQEINDVHRYGGSGLVANIELALIEYGDAKLEEAAVQIEKYGLGVLTNDDSMSLRHAGAVLAAFAIKIRALKKTK